MAKRKVLIVDDDSVVLTITESWLESCGYDVVTHDRAIGTVNKILEIQPDVLLIDVNMPFLSGRQLAEMLRGKFAKMAVIFHSSVSADELTKLVGEIGAAGAIHKAGEQKAFIQRFEHLLANFDSGLAAVV